MEMTKFGEVDEVNVCSNNGDHLRGNVYVKFYDEDDCAKALPVTNGRWYNGQQLRAELSPVTDFGEAKCRQYRDGSCNRAGNCNFMHVREPPRPLARKLHTWQTNELKKLGKKSQRETESTRSRSKSPRRDSGGRRSRSRSRERRSGGRPRSRSPRRPERGYSRSPSPKRQRRDDFPSGSPMPPAGIPPAHYASPPQYPPSSGYPGMPAGYLPPQ